MAGTRDAAENEAPVEPGAEAKPQADGPSAAGMALCAALGLASGLAALLQWMLLVAVRRETDPLFGVGSAWGDRCAAMWVSDFATAIQTVSGMPVAAWGLVWSLVAFALPLWALTRRADAARRGGGGAPRGSGAPVWPGVLITALAGLAFAIVLAVVSLREGEICGACAVSWALVLSYAMIAFVETRPAELAAIPRGISLASGAVALGYLLLFIPGLETPERGPAPVTFLARQPVTAKARAARAKWSEAAIDRLVHQLRGRRLREFSTALQLYRDAEQKPVGAPRALEGPRNAPLRFTEFTDVKCPLCATLHSTLARLRTGVPLRSFSVERRYFPRDPACNPTLDGEPGDGIRCLAARAQICFEGQADARDFAASLYRHASRLDEETVYRLAAPAIAREKLAACIDSEETEAKLQSDVAEAAERGIEAPPLLLLNGRKVPPFGPLLYTLIFAGGDADHPSFADVPPPPPAETAAEASAAGGSEKPANDAPEAPERDVEAAP